MFDIGFAELIIIALVGLVVIGPERLPEAARNAAKFLGRAKRTYSNLRRDFEREIGADEIRRELYNEALLDELKQTREQLNETINWDDTGSKSGEMTPLNQPQIDTATQTGKESSTGTEPSAGKEPSAGTKPSAGKKPSANKQPSTDRSPPSSTDTPKQ